MPRFKKPPPGFDCPYKDRCPYLETLSSHWVFSEYQRSRIREHEHWLAREELAKENQHLLRTVGELEKEVDRLRAENKRLHQHKFKARTPPASTTNKKGQTSPNGKRKRGASFGHPAWNRKSPKRIDQTLQVDAPCTCPHCQGETDPNETKTTSYIQEDIVLCPRSVMREYIHTSAWCPACCRYVIKTLPNELPFAPIGPQTKADALYLRHELKLPYDKIQQAMSTLFGINFVPASILGFEKRARKNADPLYQDLIDKVRSADLVHADETYWRQDGASHYVWYAGNPEVAVFHIDAHRSSAAAQVLLGERIEGLLVTDAYAAYNAIKVSGRQSCLAHLLRKADEIKKELEAMKKPDRASSRFCTRLIKIFKKACDTKIPSGKKERTKLKEQLEQDLDRICKKPLKYPKAETLRKRLIPDAREYNEVFAFIQWDGPPTNNHAERSLRSLVIYRKVCMGTRSEEGSENVGIFSSLTQTAKLQKASILDLFSALLAGTPAQAQAVIFNDSS